MAGKAGKWLTHGGKGAIQSGVKTLKAGGEGSMGAGLKEIGKGVMKTRAAPIGLAAAGGLGAGYAAG